MRGRHEPFHAHAWLARILDIHVHCPDEHASVVIVHHQKTVRGVEVARLGATLTPVLDKVAVLIELGDPRIAVSVGDKHAATLAPADIRLLIEAALPGTACSITCVSQVQGSRFVPNVPMVRPSESKR